MPSTTPPSSTSSTTNPPAAATTTVPPAANGAYLNEAPLAYGVGPVPSNWNVDASGPGDSHSTLSQVLAQVWPSAYYTTTSGGLVMNSTLLTSADQTGPLTVVYELNPKATWSDGQPITYRDFRYNWQAQSGLALYHDVGGRPFEARSHGGYDRIASVTGDPADPYRVTVQFAQPSSAQSILASARYRSGSRAPP